MSLDKSITHGKEHRKPYRGTKFIFSPCRNHGKCRWCRENRMHGNDKRKLRVRQEIEEWEKSS